MSTDTPLILRVRRSTGGDLVDGTYRVSIVIQAKDAEFFRTAFPDTQLEAALSNDLGAVRCVFYTARELTDGSLVAKIDIDPAARPEFFRLFPRNGLPAMLARVQTEGFVAHRTAVKKKATKLAQKPSERLYGDLARTLKFSGFFWNRSVWMHCGTDKQFLHWLRTQPCAFRKDHQCHGDIVAAHVRLGGNSGMSKKPLFSAVALCDSAHQKQHQHGYSVIAPLEEWPGVAAEHCNRWAWERLKTVLGYESFADVPPPVLVAWAQEKGVDQHLPPAYINYQGEI